MPNEIIKVSIKRLIQFCAEERYIGYSLYDSHSSPIPFKKFGRIPSFLINQVVKRSPINFRPLIGVKKDINPKGYGLFLHSYSLLSNHNILDHKEVEEKAHFFFDWLKNNPSKGYSGNCWGYNYYWPKKDGSDVPAYTPSVVVTGFIARAFLAYYESFKNYEVKDALESCTAFVLNDVHLYKGDDGYCFSYTSVKKDLTVNANLLAAEVLAYSDFVNKDSKYTEYIEEVLKFTLHHQNDDGSWYYSFDFESRKPKKQIDFHQGYVLESLLRLYKYTNIEMSSEAKNKIKKGLSFYYEQQFHKDGWCYWRFPKKWPVDNHNQSQGIITFSLFKDYDDRFLPFAEKIADWTIENMQDKRGNFYYQKWPLLTNKVNYMRWNQAWILLALATYLNERE
ncbi:MAG: terpene cyclase/mutase family protein [Bacteroidia bacterium]|nr:terpene cyclase/mutase family protein [Bacteroidia bacterium]